MGETETAKDSGQGGGKLHLPLWHVSTSWATLFTLLGLFAAALAIAWTEPDFPVEVRILAGFFVLFFLPGRLLRMALFRKRDFTLLEGVPISIALTMGVWAPFALVFYRMEAKLSTVFAVQVFVIVLLFVIAAVAVPLRRWEGPIGGPTRSGGKILVLAVTAGLAGLAYWTGAFRGFVLDWDYFNYIGGVNKLVEWGEASIRHYAYRDAPPDPIHSYNVWGLQWALISKFFEVGPLSLYVRSAFLTVPVAALSFYALGKRLIGESAGTTAFLLFVAYQVIYGGLLFIGRTTFYPADSQWLMVFPACVVLFLTVVDEERLSCMTMVQVVFALAPAVLAMSMTHVLWGLCFYITAGLYLLMLLGRGMVASQSFLAAWKGANKAYLTAVMIFAAVPLVLTLVNVYVMHRSGETDGFAPFFGGALDFSVWTWFFVFVLVPAIIFLGLVWPYRPKEGSWERYGARMTLIVVLVCLAVALPYISARSEVIGTTAWSQFGRNPYRAFLTSTMFFLNPFQRSLSNPNMTFYPLYLVGYFSLAIFWPFLAGRSNREGKGKSSPASVALVPAVLIAVPIIAFHPVFATLFAENFSLGYLRRLLRLAALFSFFPAALLVHSVAALFIKPDRHPMAGYLTAAFLSVAVAYVCLGVPAEPAYYNRMLAKTIAVAENYPKDSLIYDATPYKVIEEKGWFKKDAVIFSDIWTSYRLPAYLPQYVAVKQKPGTGVADQDERMDLEKEFFDTRTDLARKREILEQFDADGVIISKDTSYGIYGYNCGHPEAVGLLKRDQRHFELLYEEGSWAIFRYLGGG